MEEANTAEYNKAVRDYEAALSGVHRSLLCFMLVMSCLATMRPSPCFWSIIPLIVPIPMQA